MRKRRKVDPEAATPADWAEEREREEKLSSADRATREHHREIEAALEEAVGAVREAWIERRGGREGWMGETRGAVEWVKRREGGGREEVDWVGKAGEGGEREEERGALVLGGEDDGAPTPFGDIVDRIVLGSPRAVRKLAVEVGSKKEDEDPVIVRVTLVLPPSSAFLLSDFAAWSKPSSRIAAMGASRGGWDFLLLE